MPPLRMVKQDFIFFKYWTLLLIKYFPEERPFPVQNYNISEIVDPSRIYKCLLPRKILIFFLKYDLEFKSNIMEIFQ